MAINTKMSGTITILDPLTNEFIRLFLSDSAPKISLSAKNIISAATTIIL